jgi:hypothetical protein
MRRIFLLALLFTVLFSGCSEVRVRKYQRGLDPLVGSANKGKINRMLGTPTTCKHTDEITETCEYRTSWGRNDAVPSVFTKVNGFGPDLSPYEYFDVLELSYDGFGVLQTWHPLVVMQEE